MTTAVGRWLRERALPLWTTAGWDARAQTFVERLDLDGAPLLEVPRRTMVQGRQIYVMCIAARSGWSEAARHLALAAGDTLLSRFASPDGGFVFALDRHNLVVDPRRDLYTHAFVLLACAELAKLTGDAAYLERADATLLFLDTRMATPASGGYAESEPRRAEVRRQNPHMHLFEALLALHEADATRGYLARASALLDLLVRRFLVGDPAVVAETFAQNWTPLDGSDPWFEPGHHFEWIWLLDQHARLAGTRRNPCANTLLSSAVTLGVTGDMRVLDRVRASGAVVEGSVRLWPYTEAARAACCVSLGDERAVTATALLDEMGRRFLHERGTWIDRLDANGAALSAFVPASSLYHICEAVEAVERCPPAR